MPSSAITGSCLCGSVKFEVTPPFAAFRYCHCSRCQKASGSAHAANAFLPATQFKWLAGDPGARPDNSIFWKSKAAWYVSPQELKKFDEMN